VWPFQNRDTSLTIEKRLNMNIVLFLQPASL